MLWYIVVSLLLAGPKKFDAARCEQVCRRTDNTEYMINEYTYNMIPMYNDTNDLTIYVGIDEYFGVLECILCVLYNISFYACVC